MHARECGYIGWAKFLFSEEQVLTMVFIIIIL